VEEIRKRVAPDTKVLVNEIYDGDNSGVGPGNTVDRTTRSWNLAASWFGYAVGRMAEMGFEVVGQDQLAGGPAPDNVAPVSCLDWTTGDPNAKYFSIQLMAAALGTGEKKLFPSTNTSVIYALPFQREDDGRRRMIIASKVNRPVVLTMQGGWCDVGSARLVEAAAGVQEPGFQPVQERQVVGGTITLGAYALAAVVCSMGK
jgi:hypothetical protein